MFHYLIRSLCLFLSLVAYVHHIVRLIVLLLWILLRLALSSMFLFTYYYYFAGRRIVDDNVVLLCLPIAITVLYHPAFLCILSTSDELADFSSPFLLYPSLCRHYEIKLMKHFINTTRLSCIPNYTFSTHHVRWKWKEPKPTISPSTSTTITITITLSDAAAAAANTNTDTDTDTVDTPPPTQSNTEEDVWVPKKKQRTKSGEYQ